ncbi:MAG: hypothetical protein CM1200mP24_09840 [Gammaproteobacteria bacterium]|nr:MAG: hypothetical protein CM1200mP24_09840 [Gammaproteobacteria bacterium]
MPSHQDVAEAEHFYETIQSPFVGDNHTRWVDGQFALSKPELGLSNWAKGPGYLVGGDSNRRQCIYSSDEVHYTIIKKHPESNI